MKYFAYGSNMDENQMQTRCPGAKDLGLAILPGHTLFFTGRSSRWGGKGVASVKPSDQSNQRVYGRLWELTPEQLKVMDGYEGYPNNYDREELTIHYNGEIVPAQVYIKEGEYNFPNVKYTRVIKEGYKQLGIEDKFQ